MPTIILASSSPYRRQLLDQLQLSYVCDSPAIDETLLENESASAAAARLALAKARAVAERHPQGLIIGSDQTAEIDHTILGKPLSRERAIEQLSLCSGKKVRFWTGLVLLNCQTQEIQQACVSFDVYFRHLSRQVVERYIDKESPLDCAGSFKCEGLGIALFEKLQGDDPNSLIGLPLIELTSMLAKEGVRVI